MCKDVRGDTEDGEDGHAGDDGGEEVEGGDDGGGDVDLQEGGEGLEERARRLTLWWNLL